MNIGLSKARADIDCFFCIGVDVDESDESDEVDDGDEENSVEIESLDPLALPELVSAGPKQLNTTGK